MKVIILNKSDKLMAIIKTFLFYCFMLFLSQPVFSQNDSTNFLDKNTFRVLIGGFGGSISDEVGVSASINYERVLAKHLTINSLASLVIYRGMRQNSLNQRETSFNLKISSELRYYFLLKRKQPREKAFANMRAFYTGVNFYALSNRIAKLHNTRENWHRGQMGMHVRLGWQKQYDRVLVNLFGGAHVGLKKFASAASDDYPFDNVSYGITFGYLF